MKRLFLVYLTLLLLSISCQSNDQNKKENEQESTLSTELNTPTSNDSVVITSTETSDTSIHSSTDFTYAPSSTASNSRADNEFLYPLLKKKQIFTINPRKDTTLLGKEGTQLVIQANSFQLANHKQLTAPIQVSLKEFFKKSDFIINNLTTTSNGNLLESDGMIEVQVSSQGKECQLKHKKNIGIAIPSKGKQAKMVLFTGEKKENEIDWKKEKLYNYTGKPQPSWYFKPLNPSIEKGKKNYAVNKKFKVKSIQSFPKVSQKAEPFEELGHTEIIKALDRIKNTIAPTPMSIKVSFTVSQTGSIQYAKVLRKDMERRDKDRVVRALNDMKYWKPAEQNGRKISSKFIFDFEYTSDSYYEELFRSRLKGNKFIGSDSTDTYSNFDILNMYLFSSPKLGWINCDRFYQSNQKREDLLIPLTKGGEQRIKLLFKDLNSVLTGAYSGENCLFKQIPVDQKFTIIAIKQNGSDYELALQDAVVSSVPLQLNYTKVTLDELTERLKEFNAI